MEKIIDVKINCFVPALALEHSANPEGLTKKDKIRRAILRYYFNNKNFYAYYLGTHPLPFVVLEAVVLKKDPLGFAVQARVRVHKDVDNHVEEGLGERGKVVA